MLLQEDANEAFEFEGAFTACSSTLDCTDFDGCTVDSCDLTTAPCESIEIEEDSCLDCTQLSVAIRHDNYPEETKWQIRETQENYFIISDKSE